MDFLDRANDLRKPPPHGSPYSVPVPGSEKPGRSPIYRHWRFRDGILKSLDPNVCLFPGISDTITEISLDEERTRFVRKHRYVAPPVLQSEYTKNRAANRTPKANCLGWRPYDPVSKNFGKYQWLDYSTVQKRRANFGAGIVELNTAAGVTEQKYGIGLWCQNRPEWQIAGMLKSGT